MQTAPAVSFFIYKTFVCIECVKNALYCSTETRLSSVSHGSYPRFFCLSRSVRMLSVFCPNSSFPGFSACPDLSECCPYFVQTLVSACNGCLLYKHLFAPNVSKTPYIVVPGQGPPMNLFWCCPVYLIHFSDTNSGVYL